MAKVAKKPARQHKVEPIKASRKTIKKKVKTVKKIKPSSSSKQQLKKAKNQKSKVKSRRASSENDLDVIKKKPSKFDLKEVIQQLKKEPTLVLVRKALKYTRFYLKSEGMTKKLLKEIVRLWGEGSEKIRVVCLLCLIRVYTRLKDKKEQLIKQLYNSFLEKCRVTKHETMSMIAFMRHSLVELYKLDPQIAHKQAQTSVQQLTVTLKNAYTHKNEETYKTVLNWQFANCLVLLSSLVTSQEETSPVRSLAHQIIQLNLGALNIITSPRYYPYYCHLIENLINLSLCTGLFIPVLPQLLRIVDRIQYKKEPKPAKKQDKDEKDGQDEEEDDDEEMEDDEDEDAEEKKKVKEYNLDLLNHVNAEEAHTSKFEEAVLDKLYELFLRYLAGQCHHISFPELVLLPSMQLKKWVKKNNLSPHAKKFKTLLEKIKIDCDKIQEARKNIDFSFSNFAAVDAWEKRMLDTCKLCLPKLYQEHSTLK